MKKTKLIGLAALMLALGVVGCGDQPGDDPGDNPGEQECSHDWSDWKSDATKHWKECTKCGEKKSEKDHSYSSVAKDQTGVTRATCIAAGQVKKACTCGAETIVAEDATGHTMQELGAEAEGYVAANCSQAGTMPRKCRDCEVTDTVEIPVTDHNYVAVEEADAAIVATSGKVAKAATCEADGVDLTICHGCNDVKENVVAKLGHSMVTTDTAEPAAGKAAVRIYTCQNGCGKSELGFKASEASAESLPHLVIDAETGGARFWGRPIGNDVTLNESGDPSEDAHEAVFNAEQPGDFFEYVFDLTKEQADKLANCRLYCEANAAQWMNENGMDFWACKSGDTDWTRGMYVETTATHEAGTEIDNYRYILYVDDVVQDFDSTISVPAKSNSVKTEYVLPFTFHLHEGTNKIRLVMAGGYRSTFFNFIFRAIEEEQGQDQPGGDDPVVTHTHEWKSAQVSVANEGESKYSIDLCDCNKARINLDVASDLNGKITKKGGKLGSNGDTAKYTFSYDKATKGELCIKGTYDNSQNGKYGFFTGKNGGSSAVTLEGGATNTTIKFNGTVAPLPVDKTYTELGMTGTNEAGAAVISLGEVNFAAEGANEITITRNDSFAIQYFEIFVIVDAPEIKATYTDVKVWNAKTELDATLSHDYDNSKSDYVRVDTAKFRNESGEGTGSVIGFKFTAEEAKSGLKLLMQTKARSDNAKDNLFGYVANDSAVGYISDGNGGWVHPSDYRLVVRINGVQVNFKADTKGTSTLDWYLMDLADFEIIAGENTIEIEGVAGYRQDIYGIKLASVAYSL